MFSTCEKTSVSFFLYRSCPMSGSDCPRQTPLLAQPQLFVVDWCKYGQQTVSFYLLTLYWTGFLVAPKGCRRGPADCNILALGSAHLGTTYHMHKQILKHGRLLFGPCVYPFSLRKSPFQEKQVFSSKTMVGWWYRQQNAVLLSDLILRLWKTF